MSMKSSAWSHSYASHSHMLTIIDGCNLQRNWDFTTLVLCTIQLHKSLQSQQNTDGRSRAANTRRIYIE